MSICRSVLVLFALALGACGAPEPSDDLVGEVQQASRLNCALVLCAACPEGTIAKAAPGQCCPRCVAPPATPKHCGNDGQCAGCQSLLLCIGSCRCVDGECGFVCDSFGGATLP